MPEADASGPHELDKPERKQENTLLIPRPSKRELLSMEAMVCSLMLQRK